MENLDDQQHHYWTQHQRAKRHFVVNELELGLDICIELDAQADLDDYLRALITLNLLQYCSHVLSHLEKLRFLEDSHTLVAGMEKTRRADDENLVWLKESFEQVRLQLGLSRASPELGGEGSVNSQEAVANEKDEEHENGDDASTGGQTRDDLSMSYESMEDETGENPFMTSDTTDDESGDEETGQVEVPVSQATESSDYSDTWEGFED